ncbi:hypothetical protein TOI97_13105, partial [Denitrificimonas sp. JX-1]|nr:hypothetical protein [Denitrificimonas sp. JX-1]
GAAQWKNGQVYHNGHYFKVWDSYGLSQYRFRSSSFNEDARGRRYFNVVVDVEVEPEIKPKSKPFMRKSLTVEKMPCTNAAVRWSIAAVKSMWATSVV